MLASAIKMDNNKKGLMVGKLFLECFSMHTTIQKFGVGKIILMFLKEVSYAYQGCIYLMKNTVKTVSL